MAEKRTLLLLLLLAAALICFGCGAPEAAPAPTNAPEATAAPQIVSTSAKGRAVARITGETYYPSEKDWKYHFVYAYPRVLGEDYAAAAISETYQMALDEMAQLMLPMFANEESMTFDGHNEIKHDFYVTCNNDRVLSVVQTRSQTMGDEGTVLSMEPLVFDVSGEYSGETLTLRGCILAGISQEKAEDMTAEKYPQAAKILAGSSDLISEKIAEKLYPAFQEMQEKGTCRKDFDREDFELEFSPAASFYVNEKGNVVFFFPPSLFVSPSFDVPAFEFTAGEIEDLL